MNSAKTLGPNRWYVDDPDSVFHPDNILVSFRKANIVALIDKSSGRVTWKLGPYHETEFGSQHQRINVHKVPRLVDQTSGQHNPHMIAPGLPGAGNILVFDNQGGAGYPAAPLGIYAGSRILEIDPVTKEIVWQYTAEDSGLPSWTFFSSFVSNAQRLPNGNTLITEGMQGRLFQITPDGDVVWEYHSPYEGYGVAGEPEVKQTRVPGVDRLTRTARWCTARRPSRSIGYPRARHAHHFIRWDTTRNVFHDSRFGGARTPASGVARRPGSSPGAISVQPVGCTRLDAGGAGHRRGTVVGDRGDRTVPACSCSPACPRFWPQGTPSGPRACWPTTFSPVCAGRQSVSRSVPRSASSSQYSPQPRRQGAICCSRCYGCSPHPDHRSRPLAILWFGLGENSKTLVIALGVFVPVWINSHTGLASTPVDYLESCPLPGSRPVADAVQSGVARSPPPISRQVCAWARLMAFVLIVVAEMTGTTGGYRIPDLAGTAVLAGRPADLLPDRPGHRRRAVRPAGRIGHVPVHPLGSRGALTMAVQTHDLVVKFPGKQEPTLKGISLTIPDGSFSVLVGASGSGKSTLLHCLAGLITATAGSVTDNGETVNAPHPRRGCRLPARRRCSHGWTVSRTTSTSPLRPGGCAKIRAPHHDSGTARSGGSARRGCAAQRPGELSGGMRQLRQHRPGASRGADRDVDGRTVRGAGRPDSPAAHAGSADRSVDTAEPHRSSSSRMTSTRRSGSVTPSACCATSQIVDQITNPLSRPRPADAPGGPAWLQRDAQDPAPPARYRSRPALTSHQTKEPTREGPTSAHPRRLRVAGGCAAASLSPVPHAPTRAPRNQRRSAHRRFVVDPSWAQIPVASDTRLFGKHDVNVKVVNFQSGCRGTAGRSRRQVDITTAADVPTSAALTRHPRPAGDRRRFPLGRVAYRRPAQRGHHHGRGSGRQVDRHSSKARVPPRTRVECTGAEQHQGRVGPGSPVGDRHRSHPAVADAVSIFRRIGLVVPVFHRRRLVGWR